MSNVSFCSCNDHQCPFNPVNHDKGCTLCIDKCLTQSEIPSCFFNKVSSNLGANADYSFEGFAKLVTTTK